MRATIVKCAILFLFFLHSGFLLADPSTDELVKETRKNLATGISLYQGGKVASAREALSLAVASAPFVGDALGWRVYMHASWFESQTGNYAKALELSSRAFALVEQANEPYKEGRALSWMGWEFSNLGLYEAAVEAYTKAQEIGKSDDVIKYPHVWGLSTQELGFLLFKMGDAKEGEKLLRETYTYALEQEIDIGVAEGGVRLSVILLSNGQPEQAREFAEAAHAAAIRCNCSPLVVSQALLAMARCELSLAKSGSAKYEDVRRLLARLRTHAETFDHSVVLAQADILESELLVAEVPSSPDLMERRYQLVSNALGVLVERESELRGKAEIEVGKVLAERSRKVLAKDFIKHGLQVNEDMLRASEHVVGLEYLAKLEAESGNTKGELNSLIAAFRAAKRGQQALPTARLCAVVVDRLVSQKQLSKASTLALDCQRRIKDELDSLDAQGGDDDSLRRQLQELSVRTMASLGLAFVGGGPKPQIAPK